jgi:hypothetical protein
MKQVFNKKAYQQRIKVNAQLRVLAEAKFFEQASEQRGK